MSIPNLNMSITIRCTRCQVLHTVQCNADDYEAWVRGEGRKRHVQTAFPYLNADDRELLLSSTCGECFDQMFPPDPTESYTASGWILRALLSDSSTSTEPETS